MFRVDSKCPVTHAVQTIVFSAFEFTAKRPCRLANKRISLTANRWRLLEPQQLTMLFHQQEESCDDVSDYCIDSSDYDDDK